MNKEQKLQYNAYMRNWNKKNPEKNRKYVREWQKRNPEKVLEYRRRYLLKLQKDPERLARWQLRAAARVRKYAKEHPERAFLSRRKCNLRRAYGIELEEYERLLLAQHGRCAICDLPPGGKKPLGVDHDHKTNRVRGLLCDLCNRGLGLFCDSPNTLEKAIRYLKSHHGRTE